MNPAIALRLIDVAVMAGSAYLDYKDRKALQDYGTAVALQQVVDPTNELEVMEILGRQLNAAVDEAHAAHDRVKQALFNAQGGN